jgi:hypothetical protein
MPEYVAAGGAAPAQADRAKSPASAAQRIN